MRLPKPTKPYRLKEYKFNLVVTVLILSILGIMVIGSAKQSVQNKQIMGLVIGLVAMVIISLIDYVWVLNFYWILYGLNIIMLILTLVIGDTVNGAKRWINLGFTSVQPSELSKLFLILFFAKFLMDHQEDINSMRTIITSVILLIPTLVLILAQPNLSTTITIAVVFCVVMYLAGLSYKFIGTVLAIAIPVAVIFISIIVQPNQPFLEPYQQKRVLAWLEPEKYASDEAYQQNNSLMAIGSGQLKGKGLNNNTTTSVKNGNFILEPQTDFIFAIVGEELGFVGCCIVIGLLLLIVIQCILIGIKSQDMAGRIICCGIATQIGFQGFVNISVATGIFPNTGVPLPFVSYGLTSLVTLYMGIGIVLNIGLQPKKYQ
ncbi:rod shape-determining protein RodA [Bariatricus massiliensis]|uniref:Rod shape-determining protein RodA n=1 Tax=Bariatricus massiliensis TaxID=1745713 RepID=A0ABS8DCP1_9FIRM|nr:FtsW/RodA/SpoVE family cell cycle protein [Bariatricus massiliensis]MCB7303374.1 rod shape-determining protein RodA [Bariatricus massiliensis]MCB7373506.1 rod shape-determining protein RodA [Bariatricus massiliensis]MCB7386176.1 rod shape-determining protein RodA [Bariatricus massiliensis]MCB7410338.1 rod shape-determining protein RodA [Bariatricus massiliensis]MCQ5252378.1 rod shape-determining protein RodA [Bariatricus massiliensis]